MDEIEIDGVKYRLTPVNDEKDSDSDILGDYLGDKNRLESIVEPRSDVVPKAKTTGGPIKRAMGKKYGYRERYKKGKLRPSDIMAYPKRHKVVNMFDPEKTDAKSSQQAGYNVWFGPGTEIDF